jgi:toxin ParE1/3/4
MKRRAVKIGPRAAADLRRIGRYIAHFGAPISAERYVGRLYEFSMRLDLAAERGLDRSDIRPGLRVIGFEKSAVAAVLVTDDVATVVRVFFHGENWEGALRRMYGRE